MYVIDHALFEIATSTHSFVFSLCPSQLFNASKILANNGSTEMLSAVWELAISVLQLERRQRMTHYT